MSAGGPGARCGRPALVAGLRRGPNIAATVSRTARVLARLGRVFRQPSGGEHDASLVVELADLRQVARMDRPGAGDDEDAVLLVVHGIAQPQDRAVHAAPGFEHLGVEEGEVAPHVECQPLADGHVVGLGRDHAAGVRGQRAVETVTGLKRGDGVQHADVGHVPPALQHPLEPGHVAVVLRQLGGVGRGAQDSSGGTCSWAVVPHGVRDHDVDALGELVHRLAVEIRDRQVLHGA